jgi:subtilisin
LSWRFAAGVFAVALIGFLTAAPAGAQTGQGQAGDVLRAGPNGDFLNVIVVLEEDFGPGRGTANRAEAARIARSLGLNPRHVWGHALFGFAASIPPGRLEALRNDPRVAYVEFDELNSIPPPPESAQKPARCNTDPDGPGCGGGGGGSNTQPAEEVPWGIERVGADGLVNTGDGIHVYIIDSGIDNDHPDLANLSSINFAVETCQPAKKCAEPWEDDNGHGSHVAGTVGALANRKGVIGVAPGVTLHAVKVLDKQNSAFSSEIIAGIDWVASQVNGAPVVANVSIGGSGSKEGTCNDDPTDHFDGENAYQEAMCHAAHAGVVFAVAAGNEGTDAATRRPASYDDTSIAVSATGQVVDGNGDVIGDGWPSWSNWGTDDTTTWTLNDSAPVAIAAPGMGILSTWKNGGYQTISGTSMATPHVAGAIALYLASNQQDPDYSAFLNVRAALLLTAEDTTNGLFTVTNGNPHDEDFLDVICLLDLDPSCP